MASNEIITNNELKKNNVVIKAAINKKKSRLISDSSANNNIDSNQNQNLLTEKKFKKSLTKGPFRRDIKQMISSDRKLNGDISVTFQKMRNSNKLSEQKFPFKKFYSMAQYNYLNTNSFRINMKRWVFKHQILIPIIFLIYSFIILLITGVDLMNYINNRNLIMGITFCFLFESILTLLIIIFYTVNFFVLSNSTILIIILALILFLLKTANALIYLSHKNKYINFMLTITSNVLMFLVNCYNLIISFYNIKKKKVALKNIEDIINLSKKNNDVFQGKKTKMKGEQKPIALVEENIKN